MSERPPERPERPVLPLGFWALVAAVSCLRAVLAAGPDPAIPIALACAVACLAAAAALVLLRTRARAALPLLVTLSTALAAALVVGAAELARQEGLSAALSSSPVSSWELRLEGDMSEGARGWRGRARASLDGREAGTVWLVADEPVAAGTTLRCVGRFSANEDNDWGASSRGQGIAGTVDVARVLEQRPAGGLEDAVLSLRAAVLESFDADSSDARALLAGTICGSVVAISERGLDEPFAAAGVSHLVAVSGGHLVLVSAVVAVLLDRSRLGPVARTLALLGATGGFVAFCGAPASAVRSWAMSLVAEGSRPAGRRAHPLSSASVVGLGMALVEPGVTGQLGYLLSVICVCGICALGGYARYLVRTVAPRPGALRRLPGRLRPAVSRLVSDGEEALALTLVSQLVTAPLICATFSRLSLVAPLANVLLAPLFSVFLALGLVAACLAWLPPAQALVLAGADAVGGAIVWLVRLVARLPMASVSVSVDERAALLALMLALAALLAWWPRVSRRALVLALGLALALGGGWYLRWRLAAPAAVRVLDVGQGDAILVTDGAASVLVDTGPGDAVVEALARNNVFHLDAVVVTHLHDDHTGGLEELVSSPGVGRVVVAEGVADALDVPADVEEVGLGDVLRAGRFTLRVVSPAGPVDGSENEHSLELLLAFDDGTRSLTGLLTGDAEDAETQAAIERARVGDVDFLKVGHHGSAASVSEGAARALSPEVSVASAGEGNSYGHPTPECVDVLEGAGSLFLCTKDSGDVTIEPGEAGPLVSCSRGLAP